jgi:triosephosphate isomerase
MRISGHCLEVRLGKEGKAVSILYGGSVKPSHAHQIHTLPEVGSTLIGGASLKATDFEDIISAASSQAEPSLGA